MEKCLIIIRGVMGSGKSTLAKMIRDSLSCDFFEGKGADIEHCEADMYFIDSITKEYKFDATKLPLAHRQCERQTNEAMKQGKNVIVSNTFIKKKDMQVYLEMAEQYGYQIQEIICRGRFSNVHGVEKEKVEEKRRIFEY